VADTLDLLTLNEGKTAVNIPTVNTDHDTELAQHITAVSRIIDAECGPVVQRTITAEIHPGGGVVRLNYAPIVSVSLVREASGGSISNISAVAYGGSGDGYYIDPHLTGQIFRSYGGLRYGWDAGSEIEVTYVAGRYANTAAVDARFKACAASVLRRLWKRELGTWAQSSDFFETTSDSAGIGFFKVAKPIIDEMLRDQRKPPAVA
jgi:hypothetical protein